jgi:hypothetical protein
MRVLLVLLFFVSLKSFACGEEVKGFYPFSIELIESNNTDKKFKIYEILSPVKKGETFLSSITAKVEDEFQIDLDIREDFNYIGSYYRSYLSVASKYIDQIEIILSYNTLNKERSGMIFCANWKIYKLTELLNLEQAEKVPARLPAVPMEG